MIVSSATEYLLDNFYNNKVQEYLSKKPIEYQNAIHIMFRNKWHEDELQRYLKNKRGRLPSMVQKKAQYNLDNVRPVIKLLKKMGPLTAREIGKHFNQTANQITSTLYHAVSRGLIKRFNSVKIPCNISRARDRL
jgi:predicted HTH transcriptional regulator